nr:hypothetical protein CFP56_72092 [Quercus suber]
MAVCHTVTKRRHPIKYLSSKTSPPQPTQRRGRALITYGKPTKLLPLTGSQFVQNDIFDFPSDDGEEPTAITLESCQRPSERPRSSNGSVPSNAESYRTQRTRPEIKKVQRKPLKPAVTQRRARGRAAKERSHDSLPDVRTSRPSRTKKQVTHVTGPRLALNELVLVDHPMSTDYDREPESSPPTLDKQDPIQSDVSISYQSHQSRASFTTPSRVPGCSRFRSTRDHRKRHLHQIKAVRRRKRGSASNFIDRMIQRGADGFELSETKVDLRYHSTRRRRSSFTPHWLSYAALELGTGPLPDVDFDTVDKVLPLSLEPDRITSTCPKSQHARRAMSRDDQNAVLQPRKVSVSVEDEWIKAQLSSISAPRREEHENNSDSESQADNSEESDGDDDVESAEEESEEEIAEEEDCESLPWTQNSDHWSMSTDEQGNKLLQMGNSSVDLTLRRPDLSGLPCRQSLRSKCKMEVNEAISDPPDSPSRDAEPSFCLMPITPITIQSAQPQRRRSILKKTISVPLRASSRAEQTNANTRRDTSILDVVGSTYSSSAPRH